MYQGGEDATEACPCGWSIDLEHLTVVDTNQSCLDGGSIAAGQVNYCRRIASDESRPLAGAVQTTGPVVDRTISNGRAPSPQVGSGIPARPDKGIAEDIA